MKIFFEKLATEEGNLKLENLEVLDLYSKMAEELLKIADLRLMETNLIKDHSIRLCVMSKALYKKATDYEKLHD